MSSIAKEIIDPSLSINEPTIRLHNIGLKHKTDKSYLHNYLDFYETHISKYKNEKIRLLEIGIGHGASLKMWEEYFPNAEIFGVDIDKKCLKYIYKSGRVKTLIGDQSNRIFLNSIQGEFDIILDDGGHTMSQQMISFGCLFKKLKSEGIYIIENIHTSFMGAYGGNPDNTNTVLSELRNWNVNKKITSKFLLEEEGKYIEANAGGIIFKGYDEINIDKNNITSVIKKGKYVSSVLKTKDTNKTKCTLETYIVCHDQNIILKNEKENKFSNIGIYKYVFVGNGEIDKIQNNSKVIIARKLPINIESHPNLTAFTAWYALCKNNLITSDIVNIFEYDVILRNTSLNLFIEIEKAINNNINIIGYISKAIDSSFINNPNWIGDIFKGIKEVYGIDLENIIRQKIKTNPKENWICSSNISISKSEINEYVTWFEKLIPYIISNKFAGHIFERTITLYCLLKNKPYSFIEKYISHIGMDSHGTQGRSKKEKCINLPSIFQPTSPATIDYVPPIVAITSISPYHINNNIQKQAIDSWMNLGMKVYSINNAEEIKILKLNYPKVEFVQTNRTMKQTYGKNVISISSIIDFAKTLNNSYCIINSDIELDYNKDLLTNVKDKLKQSLVVCNRLDYDKKI